MKYYKTIDGNTVFYNGEPIVLDDMQVFNPTPVMLEAAGWQEYVESEPQEPTQEELLEQAKEDMLQTIMEYDNSDEVNGCLIHYGNEYIPYWADKNERTALKEAVKDCIAVGLDTYRLDLRDFGVSIEVDCELMLGMLQQLEVYAIRCYNKTTDHIYAVKAMTDIDEVRNYHYDSGYPTILEFSV